MRWKRPSWVHHHTLVPDGVFYEDDDGALQFHGLPPPTDEDVQRLVATVRKRIVRLLERCGLGDPTTPGDAAADTDSDPVHAAEPALAPLLGASVQGAVAFGPDAGALVRRIGRDPRAPWGP